MITRRHLAILLALLLALLPSHPLPAQVNETEIEIPLASLYDLDSTSYIYCVTTGENGQVLNPSTNNGIRVTSTTTALAAATASTSPFSAVAVGDEITVITPSGPGGLGIPETRVVTVRTDANNITMNAAFTAEVTNVQFSWRDRTCGTAATSGWFPVSTYRGVSVSLQVTQIVVTGHIDFKVQCRQTGVDNTPVDVYAEGMSNYRTGGYDAAQVDNDLIIIHNGVVLFNQCRVGMLIHTADDGDDLTTNAEQVTVKLLLTR